MKRPLLTAFVGLSLLPGSLLAQWTTQQSGTRASLRGLSVVSEQVVWASGSSGTYVRTVDGGQTWRADTVPGAGRLDFRDVHAFSADSAILMSAGEDARFYLTTDGGKSWTVTYANRSPGVFFDGMAFWDQSNGVAFSDPVDGSFLLITTADAGRSWREVNSRALPRPLDGEAGFAASGTGIAVFGGTYAWFGTGGGAHTRVIYTSDRGMSWRVAELPMAWGKASTGVFSLVFVDSLRGVAVGGDYQEPRHAEGNAAFTTDGGRSWTAVTEMPPRGYRSAVARVPGTPAPTLIAVGTSGSDYSVDCGKSWAALSEESFNAVQFASAAAGWAVGDGGRIARFTGAVPLVRRDGEGGSGR